MFLPDPADLRTRHCRERLHESLSLRRRGGQSQTFPSVGPVTEMAMVDAVAALDSHEPGIGVDTIVIDAANLRHGAIAHGEGTV